MSLSKKFTYEKGLCGRYLSVSGPLPNKDPIPSPPVHTVYVYTVYLFTLERGGKLTKEKVRVATVHEVGSKKPT
jgi:hypothetical protein